MKNSKIMATSVYSVSMKKENAHDDPIRCCAWTHISKHEGSEIPPSDIIVTAGSSPEIKVWEWMRDNTLNLIKVLKDHIAGITSLSISQDGQTLVSTAMDFTLVVWDLIAGERIHRIAAPTIWRATFAPDGLRVVAGTDSGGLQVYDIVKGSVINVRDTGEDFVLAVAWCPNDKFVASGSRNGAVCVFNSVQFNYLRTFKDQTEKSVKNLAFSPNSKLLASSFQDGAFKLFDVVVSVLLYSLQRSSWAVALCFCPAGKRFALSTDDGEVIISSIKDFQIVKIFKEHDEKVWDLQFNKKGDRLLSVGQDKSVNIYECPPLPKNQGTSSDQRR